ncbi:hypothetical protein [Burkholderia plantarii]|uniref:hypothetical protein n=1 Tax=Burkholderia plantarii TaxID=41899 RepID=UPI000F4FD7F3|nr:hypothetical protein [Burkholderia plantarii]
MDRYFPAAQCGQPDCDCDDHGLPPRGSADGRIIDVSVPIAVGRCSRACRNGNCHIGLFHGSLRDECRTRTGSNRRAKQLRLPKRGAGSAAAASLNGFH